MGRDHFLSDRQSNGAPLWFSWAGNAPQSVVHSALGRETCLRYATTVYEHKSYFPKTSKIHKYLQKNCQNHSAQCLTRAVMISKQGDLQEWDERVAQSSSLSVAISMRGTRSPLARRNAGAALIRIRTVLRVPGRQEFPRPVELSTVLPFVGVRMEDTRFLSELPLVVLAFWGVAVA